MKRITLELNPSRFARLERVAARRGASVHETAKTLLAVALIEAEQ